MDYQKLDDFLRRYNEEELENKRKKTAQSDYSKCSQITIRGIQAAVMKESCCSLVPSENSQIRSFVVSKHPRFMDVAMHTHEWIEMSYIYSGTIEETIEDKKYHLKKGQICIIDTGTPHAITRAEEDDIMINLLMRKEYFTANFLSRFSSQNLVTNFIIQAISKKTTKENYIVFESQDSRRLEVLMKELMCEYMINSLNHDDILDAYMSLIFLELIQIQEHHMSSKKMKAKKVSMLSVLQYMEQNYQSCTLGETAKYFNLNPSYLSSLMKKELHSSYKDVLMRIRMNYARDLLEKTDMTVVEILNSVGYENISFFYTKFEESYGCTPGEYRNKIR